jgi:hypothetical protein
MAIIHRKMWKKRQSIGRWGKTWRLSIGTCGKNDDHPSIEKCEKK